ncbi:MAG: hypothetical protein ACUZ77_10030 [Candidatus Brocadiales bacterium]
MTENTVQNFRNAVRPFLTIFFSMLFGTIIIIGILCDKLDMKEALIAVGTPLGTIMGYHFGKKSTIDIKKKKPSPQSETPIKEEETPSPQSGTS